MFNEDFFKSIIESSFDGIVVTDADGIILYVNPAWQSISGWRSEEVVGKVTPRIIKSNLKDRAFYADLWARIKKGEVFRTDITNKRKDGTLYDVEEIIIPWKDTDGEIRHFIGVQRDISEKKRIASGLADTQTALLNILEDEKILEAQLKEERDQSRAIISSMSEGLFIVDKEYKILSLNPAASVLLETSETEAIGQSIKKIVAVFKGDKELADAEWPISQVLDTGAPAIRSLEDNVFFQLRSGRKMPVVIFASPLRGDGVTGVVIVFRDVTDEYKLNEAKNEFVSVASHQLRTPLTAVRWYSEMLLAGDAGALNKGQKEFVEQVYAGAGHLIDIINVLLSLARIEGGRIKIDPVPIDIPAFMKEVAMEFTPLAAEKKLSIRILPPARPLASIRLDPSLFRQVVINLISNAVRYALPEGKIEIGFVDHGDHAQIYIKDNGIGIPDGQKERIFEKFFRADNAISNVPEGTGLGMNLAREIVRIWKGKIWFKSPAEWERADGTKEMKGTAFYFIVPYKGMEARFAGKPLA